jgi:hypothetical protein
LCADTRHLYSIIEDEWRYLIDESVLRLFPSLVAVLEELKNYDLATTLVVCDASFNERIVTFCREMWWIGRLFILTMQMLLLLPPFDSVNQVEAYNEACAMIVKDESKVRTFCELVTRNDSHYRNLDRNRNDSLRPAGEAFELSHVPALYTTENSITSTMMCICANDIMFHCG